MFCRIIDRLCKALRRRKSISDPQQNRSLKRWSRLRFASMENKLLLAQTVTNHSQNRKQHDSMFVPEYSQFTCKICGLVKYNVQTFWSTHWLYVRNVQRYRMLQTTTHSYTLCIDNDCVRLNSCNNNNKNNKILWLSMWRGCQSIDGN